MPPNNNLVEGRSARCALYSNKSRRALWRNVSYRAGHRILGLLPNLDIDSLFARNNPNFPTPRVRHAIVMSTQHRFLVVGYRNPRLPPNPIIASLANDLVWRGEVAVFHIGWAIPYLVSPATKKLRDDAVAIAVVSTEASSEDESRISVIIPLKTSDTRDYDPTPGLAINPHRTDWLIVAQGQDKRGSMEGRCPKEPSYSNPPKEAPLKATTPKSSTIGPESKELKDEPPTDHTQRKPPKATPHRHAGASEDDGIKIEETEPVADQAQKKGAGVEEHPSPPSKDQRSHHGERHNTPSNPARGSGADLSGDHPTQGSNSTRGKAREANEYDGSDEDSESDVHMSVKKLALLRLNIKCIVMLLAPQEKAKDVAIMANSLASIVPNYSTLVADLRNRIQQITGPDSSVFLATLGCTVTALIFSIHPPDSSVPASQFKEYLPVTTLDGRVFNLLCLLMSSNNREEARRLTTYLLSNDTDLRHEFIATCIEAAHFSRDRDTIHAVAHGILALRKLTKWEEACRNTYVSFVTITPRGAAHYCNPTINSSHADTRGSAPAPNIVPPATSPSTPPPTPAPNAHPKFEAPPSSPSSHAKGEDGTQTQTNNDATGSQSASHPHPLPKESTPISTKSKVKFSTKGLPDSRLPHVTALIEKLSFHGGNDFNHYSTVTDKDLIEPGEGAVSQTSVYTHTNTRTGSTKVWMRGPNNTVWRDVSKEYFALEEVPHPTLPKYFLSRNRSTKYECPNFIKGIKKYAKDFEKREFDYIP